MFGLPLPRQRALLLSREEALALLEMCTLTLAPEVHPHGSVVWRISQFCREFLAEEQAAR